jgi:hypothetical protein
MRRSHSGDQLNPQATVGARWILQWKIMVILVAFCGCKPAKPELMPVTGKVTMAGQPVPLGSIQFIAENQRPAYGQIGPDGSFSLETDGEKGCVKGQHRVVIQAEKVSGTPETGEMVTPITPPRYASVATTDIVIDVDGPKENLTIDLKKE